MVNVIDSVQIGRGSVFHSRHQSSKNSFLYSTFYIYFNCANEKELQWQFSKRFYGLLGFRSEKYLLGYSGPIAERIEDFLKTKLNYTAESIWLHTMPAILGFIFNPVNFWMCYREGKLEGVLCEVNNTFGERHFYWLYAPSGIQSNIWLTAQKVFHVSPFFPVEGSYRFRFQVGAQSQQIDIQYYDQKDNLALSTWVRGEMTSLNNIHLFNLITEYGWLTVMVVARIHFQALRLFLKRVKFYSKPSPPTKEISYGKTFLTRTNVAPVSEESPARND